MTATIYCLVCRLTPCVCRYIDKLRPGGELADRLPEAQRMVQFPLPVVEGRETYHYSTCPCVRCHSLRLSTFTDYPNITSMPAPPEWESWQNLEVQ
ncbi:hypothetical protein BTZ20_4473 [Rhodococcus sp. MTM3W5.2]|uniref:hypothetical protein n=1 Tax=Rhodococcus sp. MTM3W5.2 TaxID=1805827 RepID=UPI0009797D61|nr:hypothetical protein [Rhodococcus sp. MTM3W5.2]AQA23515.1 hypothetical protein BTZ20_4473 [Rhodococcus sp. MTM3W5.2]